MFKLRKELVARECPTQIDIGAVAHRALRAAELLQRMREIAQRN